MKKRRDFISKKQAQQRRLANNRGFTLIETLVVISIITLLSSILLVAFVNARGAASDANKQQNIQQVYTALQLFYGQNNRMPKNYNGGNCTDSPNCSGFHPLGALGGGTFSDSGHLSSSGPYSSFMACDNNLPGYAPSSDANTFVYAPQAYNASMQELVDAGILGSVPHSPSDSTYCYYDQGHSSNVGALLFTELIRTSPGATPVVANCAPLVGLCSSPSNPTVGYCLCEPY